MLKGQNKKVIGLIKNELGGKIITKFVRLREQTYSYLMDDGNGDKKTRHENVCHKRKN